MHIAKLAIDAALVVKFRVGSALDDLAVLHNEDEIGVANRRKAMGDREDRAIRHELYKRVLHQLLGYRIERTRRLVENEDRGLADGSASDVEELPLTLREVGTVTLEHRVVSVGETHDEAVCAGGLRGFDDFLVGRVGIAPAHVVADGAREQEHILQHLTKVLSKRTDLDVFDVNAINEDLTLLDVEVTADQVLVVQKTLI